MVIGQVIWLDQKQPFRGVLRKRCSENMQQIYEEHPCQSAISLSGDQKHISSGPKGFLRKDVLKICSKFTGEHPYQSVISVNLQSNYLLLLFRIIAKCLVSQLTFPVPIPDEKKKLS